MTILTDQILTVAQMRAAEDTLMRDGQSVDSLMLTAGRGAADWVWRMAGQAPVTILCGPGNNGGDGYVIAETLRRRGTPVAVVAPIAPATQAAKNARNTYQGQLVSDGGGLRGAVFVDCLFGSGLMRPLSEGLLAMLAQMAGQHGRAVAIDLPSGVESDSGQMLNDGLPRYDLTVCLGAWKYAHWLMPGARMMGRKHLVPIGIARAHGSARLLAKPVMAAPVGDAHKYSRGMLGIIAGQMPGAALLASRAAMHGGAGYVKLLGDMPGTGLPAELVADGRPIASALSDARFSALLIGPGLGRDGAALARLKAVCAADVPMVLDADALMLLRPDMLSGRKSAIIATPHAGELAALCRAFDIAGHSRLENARTLAGQSGMVIIAKGPDTVIAAPDAGLVLCPAPSSWLSIAGTGDVLAGLVASALASRVASGHSSGQGAIAASCQAVWLHGEAARIAGPAFGAGDLADIIPQAVSNCL